LQKQYQVDVPKLNYTTLWHIGLTYTNQKNQQFNNLQPTVWMNNTETEVTIPLMNDAGWVIFNLQSTGTYDFIQYQFHLLYHLQFLYNKIN